MKFRDRERRSTFEINLTPLIDVVFLLLIFFMVSTTFMFTGAIEVDLPRAQGEEVEIKKNVRISINAAGDVFIDGERYNDDQLSGILRLKKEKGLDAVLVIEADKKTTHGKVVLVIDEGKKAGFEKFAIATEEE